MLVGASLRSLVLLLMLELHHVIVGSFDKLEFL
uniref:Uncharacterized protein n=1 Tax=Rhizophora mucronata TaxID=61149 RepID=A0A2P2NDM8_RHIMU